MWNLFYNIIQTKTSIDKTSEFIHDFTNLTHDVKEPRIAYPLNEIDWKDDYVIFTVEKGYLQLYKWLESNYSSFHHKTHNNIFNSFGMLVKLFLKKDNKEFIDYIYEKNNSKMMLWIIEHSSNVDLLQEYIQKVPQIGNGIEIELATKYRKWKFLQLLLESTNPKYVWSRHNVFKILSLSTYHADIMSNSWLQQFIRENNMDNYPELQYLQMRF